MTLKTYLLLIFAQLWSVYTYAQDSFTPFRVTYYSGDETIEKHEIIIYKKNNKYYADNLSPYFYVGKYTDGIWTTELDNNKMAACVTFLNKAKTFTEDCPVTSTNNNEYQITTGGNTLKITGDCDWDGNDFLTLRSELFFEKFSALEARRRSLTDSLNKKLMGKWYFMPLKSKPDSGSYLVLTKTVGTGQTCTWEMGSSNSFKSSCNEVLNLTYSIRYILNVDKNIFFEIQGGTSTDKNGNTTVQNYGATFTIESVTDNELRLKYLWR